MSARDLLANATPRPWCDCLSDGIYTTEDEDGLFIIGAAYAPCDQELIVQAVNEYEALLDIADLLAKFYNGIFPGYITEVRAALARLASLRSSTDGAS